MSPSFFLLHTSVILQFLFFLTLFPIFMIDSPPAAMQDAVLGIIVKKATIAKPNTKARGVRTLANVALSAP